MALNGHASNGASSLLRPLKPGVYAPIPAFFLPDSEDLGADARRRIRP